MSQLRLGVNIDHVATVRGAFFPLPLREGANVLSEAKNIWGRGMLPHSPSPDPFALRATVSPPPARGGGIGMVRGG